MNALQEREPARALTDPLLNFTAAMRDYVGESRTTAWRRLQAGEINAFKIGRRWKVRQSELFRFIRALEPTGDAA